MKIVVCLKQVPDTETRVQIAPEGDRIAEGTINWIVSPYDEFAIEEALKIKEAKSGEVVLVTVGPERAQSAHDFARQLLRFVPFADVRTDLFLGEGADAAP